jgi:Gpi18-like mannosyltransferase
VLTRRPVPLRTAMLVSIALVLLALLLRREILWRYIVLIPLIYAAAMMPAWLAGRPWKELLLVYVSQSGFYHKLSMNAANLYAFAERLGLSYEVGVPVGLAIAAAAGLVIPMYAHRLQVDDAEAKLLVATASALLMPFLLPKMHDRFFFAADVFTFMLACALPRFWWLATAMQASSVAAYLGFLFGVHRGSYVGALFSIIAVAGLVWALYQRLAPSGRVAQA